MQPHNYDPSKWFTSVPFPHACSQDPDAAPAFRPALPTGSRPGLAALPPHAPQAPDFAFNAQLLFSPAEDELLALGIQR